eukprot:1522160-Rhodomonas_salina.1
MASNSGSCGTVVRGVRSFISPLAPQSYVSDPLPILRAFDFAESARPEEAALLLLRQAHCVLFPLEENLGAGHRFRHFWTSQSECVGGGSCLQGLGLCENRVKRHAVQILLQTWG